jgi:hypothetical protein
MRKPRAALLRLSITLSFALSVLPVHVSAKGPSFKETIDFIVLKLSGAALSSSIPCDKVQECTGVINTAWQSSVAPSFSSCSIEVTQTINVTKSQNATCIWTGDIIRGKLWNHVTYQREYHFRLDLGNISRDGITVEQATPENPRCSIIRSDLLYFVYRSDLPYAVHLTFNKRLDVSFQVKATGSGNGEEATSVQRGTDSWNNDSLPVGSEDIAEKLARAFEHAASLCGAKKAVF